ncbi:hypothetical protein I315_02889 [Cryptococcus gattii Ru294]|nr:hypothetical protein I315_02889 [Cryptococcus gattii Ru294]
MPVSEDIRLKSRHTAQQKFQALMLRTKSPPVAYRLMSKSWTDITERHCQPTLIEEGMARSPDLLPFSRCEKVIHTDIDHGFSADFCCTVATFKAFMRVRAMMIEKPRFPNGRTSTRAMKGVPISSADRHQVEAYIDTDLKRELSLNTGTFAKPITSFADFMRLLNACWSAAAQFRSPREAKQPAFLPWRSDPDISEGIIWGQDITGALFVPDGIDEVRIKYMIKWRSLKGKRNTDADSKDGYHEREEVHLAGLDATLFITAFGLEDQVFEHFSRYEQIGSITAATVRDAGGEIPLVIKESARQTRLLQDIRYDPTIQKWRTYPEQAIRYSTMREKWKALLRLCGYDEQRAMGLTRYGTSAAELPSHRLRNAEVPEHITKMREKLDEQDLRSSFVKEQSIERARLAFRPSSACDPVSTISASLLNKDSGRAKPPPFNPDFPLDPALFEEEDQDQGESMAGQSTGEADNVDQEFEDELEPTAVLRHQPDHQRLIDALTAHCATSVLPVADDSRSAKIMSRTDIIHSITHASFFTRQKHCFDYPGEIPTEGQCCPVTGCTYNTSDLTASKAASHIHACVKAAIGREVWIKYEEHFCLKTCPWQGCLHLIFDNAIQAAEHFFVKHVNGPAVSIKCAVQLEDGVCDAPCVRTCCFAKPTSPINANQARKPLKRLRTDAHLNCSRRRFRQWIVDSAGERYLRIPSDLAEHLRTKHSIRLTGNGTSKKSYAPLNGNLSRLLSDYRGNYAKEETGHNSELTDDSAQPLRKRRKPVGTMAAQHNKDRFAKMTGKCIKA